MIFYNIFILIMSINASIYSKATNNKLQSLDELIEQKV